MVSELEARKVDREKRERARLALTAASIVLQHHDGGTHFNQSALIDNIRGLMAVFDIDDDARTFRKAIERGNRTFTLVDQDKLAAETIEFWCTLAEGSGVHRLKIDKARDLAAEFRGAPVKKTPD